MLWIYMWIYLLIYIFSFIQLPWFVYISSNDFITSIIVGTDDVHTMWVTSTQNENHNFSVYTVSSNFLMLRVLFEKQFVE